MWKRSLMLTAVLLISNASALVSQARGETLNAYVDSDLCSHLMMGPVSDQRIECSQKTHKQGSAPVLVRLQDSFVLEVNKQKMLNEHVGGFVEATGEPKERDGRMKLQSVKPIDAASIPAGRPERHMLDVRQYRTSGDRTFEEIRHQLALMPYITEFDFVSFAMTGGQVILSGWTVRQTNRSTAYNLVKNIEGVTQVTNNIEVLPMGRNDMTIRANARARLQRLLPRYFWGSGSDIKIIVNNGDITLLGTVATRGDHDVAFIQCNSIPGAFKVFNLLRVSGEKAK
jgi:osmotically-inducible protein OsmY